MQAQTQSSSAVEASTPPNIKRYLVKETWKEYEVTLEVNHDVLTKETASLINGFWSNAGDRLSAENGDIVRTVIRLFGQTMIYRMLSEGGASFSITTKHCMTGDNPGHFWTQDLHNEEGWGGNEPGPYGFCGIRVIAADVDTPSYDDVELVEVSIA
ncbi:uncharacterized protein DUF2528 [Pseudomonas tolaasii NCPPB 2192]|uniref:Uncharacterized protein DUF2528 n=1 Tax=Pseudomonas tolaasii NCPPB 2192 TaxID=564423 RepID=A0ABX4QR58_PSETO|nr:DUF2528 family protein [Pseudomonas tolaasii]ARB26527.1 hypothetical protein B5P22_04270 [Pseudomonas tolaasii]KAB0465079.1 DUF2528 family protein [Pseudomonas tolaasii]PKA79047.1 uncharacterized protein DUF2528 [Pseudomonas tolaasii NCPPB 2192]